MKIAHQISLTEPSTVKARLSHPADISHRLISASVKLGSILMARGMSLRISVGTDSFIVGHRSTTEEPVEFSFSSTKVFFRLFRRLRLIDFVTAYFDGQLEVKGSIFRAVDVLYEMNLVTDKPEGTIEFCWRLIVRSLKAASTTYATTFESLGHYSQNPQAYELFLDDNMQYTCGHFPKGTEDIDEAQIAKFRLIEALVSRHSGSLMGKAHLDVGSGWGGMGAYFQNQFKMRSVGNTNCRVQMEYSQQRFDSEILFGDFLELRQSNERFDLITVVGMIEHLTPYRRDQLLDVIKSLLAPDGVVYLQCITKPTFWMGGDTFRVAQREIFPGHFLETPSQTEHRLNAKGLAIVEKFEHCSDYALTTMRWVEKIQKNENALCSILGPRQYRMYLGYLAFASKLFSIEGRGSLMRYIVKKSGT